MRTFRPAAPIGVLFAAVLVAMAAGAASPPSLLVLPLDMVDTSGETPPRVREHEDRLKALDAYLSQTLADAGIYAIVDPAPIDAAIARARSAQPLADCNGCERDLAGLVHADRVLVGQIDKVSTLIGHLSLRIVDVATGRTVLSRTLDFRGDTDDAWRHAVRFLVRDLAQTAPQQR